MYMCDECGYSKEKPGVCMFCQVPLSAYTKEIQDEYQADTEEPMRLISQYRWYV